MYYVKLSILASTPRSVYDVKYVPSTIAWGTVFPITTLLVVISKSLVTFRIECIDLLS